MNEMEREEKVLAFRNLREMTGLNRREFSERFGIPYPTLCDWELGHRRIPEYLLRLLQYRILEEAKKDKIEKAEDQPFLTLSWSRRDVVEHLVTKGIVPKEEQIEAILNAENIEALKKETEKTGWEVIDSWTE